VANVTRQFTLGIANGLHLAPISRVVQALGNLDCQVQIEFDGRTADARSASELMLLAATHGAPLSVSAQGAEAEVAADVVVKILENPEPPRETVVRPK